MKTPRRSWKTPTKALLRKRKKKKKKSTAPFNPSRKRNSVCSLNYLEPETCVWISVLRQRLIFTELAQSYDYISNVKTLYSHIFTFSMTHTTFRSYKCVRTFFKHTKFNCSAEKRQKVFPSCTEINTTETFQFCNPIFWLITQQMLEGAMQVRKKKKKVDIRNNSHLAQGF